MNYGLEFQTDSGNDRSNLLIVRSGLETFQEYIVNDAGRLVIIPVAAEIAISYLLTGSQLLIIKTGGDGVKETYATAFDPPYVPLSLEYRESGDWINGYNVYPPPANGFTESYFDSASTLIAFASLFLDQGSFTFGSEAKWLSGGDAWQLLFGSDSYLSVDLAVISKSLLNLPEEAKAESILFAILLRIQRVKLAGFPIEVIQTGTFFKSMADRKYLVFAYRFKALKLAPMNELGELSKDVDQPLRPKDL